MNGKKSARHLFSFRNSFLSLIFSRSQMPSRENRHSVWQPRNYFSPTKHNVTINEREMAKDGHQLMIKWIMNEKKMLNMQENCWQQAAVLWECEMLYHDDRVWVCELVSSGNERLRLLVMVVTRSQFIVHHAEQGWG